MLKSIDWEANPIWSYLTTGLNCELDCWTGLLDFICSCHMISIQLNVLNSVTLTVLFINCTSLSHCILVNVHECTIHKLNWHTCTISSWYTCIEHPLAIAYLWKPPKVLTETTSLQICMENTGVNYLMVLLNVVRIGLPSSSIRCSIGFKAPLSTKFLQLHAVFCFWQPST